MVLKFVPTVFCGGSIKTRNSGFVTVNDKHSALFVRVFSSYVWSTFKGLL